jgi:uncharacterized protein YgiM (DUF1202 family)
MVAMQPRFAILAAGCVLLAVATQAQTSMTQTETPPAPTGETLPSPAEASQLNSTPIKPPSTIDQPGNPDSPTSNLSEMTVARDGTEIREMPDKGSQLLASLDTGTQVLVIGKANGWSHVLVGGTDGFVTSDSLK